MPKRSVKKKVSLSFGKKQRNTSSLFWFLILFIFLPLLLWAVYQKTQTRSKATYLGNESKFVNAIHLTNENLANDSYGVTTPKIIVTNPFTIEMFVNIPSTTKSGSYSILSLTSNPVYSPGLIYVFTASVNAEEKKFRPYFIAWIDKLTNEKISVPKYPATSELQFDVWHHIAVVYRTTPQSCIFELFVNGKYVDGGVFSFSNCNLVSETPKNLYLGTNPVSYLSYSPYNFSGYIDELRISNNIRYSGINYTVPTSEFTIDNNTIALYHFNEFTGSKYSYDSGLLKMDLVLNGPQISFGPIQPPTPTPTPPPPPRKPQPKKTFRVETLLQYPDGKRVPFLLVNARTIVRYMEPNGKLSKPRVCYQGNNDGQCPVTNTCMTNGLMTLPIKSKGSPCASVAPGWYSTHWNKTVTVSGKTYELLYPTTCSGSVCTQEEQIVTSGKPLHRGIYRELP